MRSIGCMLALVATLCATTAHAEPTEDGLIEQGLERRREGRDAEALDLFRQADKEHPSSRARAQIALAEQALGQWLEADRDLRQALSSKEDPWITSHKGALDGALEVIGRHLGTVVVKTNVATAEVWLNDARFGELSADPLRVRAGQLRIELRSKGYERATRTIVVAPATTVTAEIPLTPETSATPVAASTPLAFAAVDNAPREERRPRPENTDAARPRPDATRRAFAWGALGAAGALLGGAVVAQIVREEKADHYNDDTRCFYGDLSRDQRCGVYRGQAESAQTFATVGYVASGALGIASAILFLAVPPPTKSRDWSLRLDVGSSHAAIGVGGRM
jgi:hypothetical protein